MNNQQKIDRAHRCFLSDVHVEQRAAGEPESRTITGYAVKFEQKSVPIWGSFEEIIRRGAFDKADMENVVMNFNHDDSKILARSSSGTLSFEIDEIGVRFSFEAPNTTLGNDMLELVRRGDVNQCSFAFTVEEETWTWRTELNGMEYDLREIISISKVYDFSLVVHPAYPSTEAHTRTYQEFRSARVSQEPPADPPADPPIDLRAQHKIDQRYRHIKMKSQL